MKKKSRLETLSCYVTLSQVKETEIKNRGKLSFCFFQSKGKYSVRQAISFICNCNGPWLLWWMYWLQCGFSGQTLCWIHFYSLYKIHFSYLHFSPRCTDSCLRHEQPETVSQKAHKIKSSMSEINKYYYNLVLQAVILVRWVAQLQGLRTVAGVARARSHLTDTEKKKQKQNGHKGEGG